MEVVNGMHAGQSRGVVRLETPAHCLIRSTSIRYTSIRSTSIHQYVWRRWPTVLYVPHQYVPHQYINTSGDAGPLSYTFHINTFHINTSGDAGPLSYTFHIKSNLTAPSAATYESLSYNGSSDWKRPCY